MTETTETTELPELAQKLPSDRIPSRFPNIQFALPILTALALLLTDRWFPAVDDECAIIDRAARPVAETLRLYLSGAGEHEHPPLYDLIFHGWLQLTNGAMHLLRVPAIAFYMLGMWALAAAAKHLAGVRAQTWTLILLALWPFGFHFGRVAAWYSFCFMLVGLVTWMYLKYVANPTAKNWTLVLVSSLLLVYSNYFGWAILGCLALDFVVRDWRALIRRWRLITGGIALLLLAYLPVAQAFLGELHRGAKPSPSLVATLLTGIYNLYCVFVSESVAPWFWTLGVPAAIAIAGCLCLILIYSPRPSTRFLVYFLGLLAVLTILGVVETKRVLLIGPWLILPIAVALSTPSPLPVRRGLIVMLAAIGGIGWYGIFARTLYAAPHWIEPWPSIAQQAASVARAGGVVIGNNASFFFYMTYVANLGDTAPVPFTGLLPDSPRRPGVYDPEQWLEAGAPVAPTVMLVKGLHFHHPDDPTLETEAQLNRRCAMSTELQMVPDPGARWKQRYAPASGQLPWRVQVVTYACR